MERMVRMLGNCTVEDAEKFGGVVGSGYVDVPLKYYDKLTNNDAYTILICDLIRPGLQLFATKLEHTLFPPSNSQLNALLQLGIYKWAECDDFPFMILVIPALTLPYAEGIAAACGLKFTKAHPVLLNSEDGKTLKQTPFPITGTNVHRIESLLGSSLYATMSDLSDLEAYKARTQRLLDDEQIQTDRYLESIGVIKPNMKETANDDTQTDSGVGN